MGGSNLIVMILKSGELCPAEERKMQQKEKPENSSMWRI